MTYSDVLNKVNCIYKDTGLDEYFATNYGDDAKEVFSIIYPMTVMTKNSNFDYMKYWLNDEVDYDFIDINSIMKYFSRLWLKKNNKIFSSIREATNLVFDRDIDGYLNHVIFIESLNDNDIFDQLIEKYGSIDGFGAVLSLLETEVINRLIDEVNGNISADGPETKDAVEMILLLYRISPKYIQKKMLNK